MIVENNQYNINFIFQCISYYKPKHKCHDNNCTKRSFVTKFYGGTDESIFSSIDENEAVDNVHIENDAQDNNCGNIYSFNDNNEVENEKHESVFL